MKKFIMGLLIIITIVAMGLASCAQPTPQQTITLKAVSFLAENEPATHFLLVLRDKVKAKSNGALVIDYKGGPEVIPQGQLTEALRTGAIDLINHSHAFFKSEIPEASMTNSSEYTPSEERKNGYIDFLNQLHQANGSYFLGRAQSLATARLFTNKAVSKPQDFAGQKFRSLGAWDNPVKALGAVPVNIPLSEAYTALEKKVVDGYIGALVAFAKNKLYEVCKNYTQTYFFEQQDVVHVLNLKAWNSLPKNLQQLLIDIQIDMENNEIRQYYSDLDKKSIEEMEKGGCKPMVFSPEDSKWLRGVAYKSNWEEGKKVIKTPQNYDKLRKLLAKDF